VNIFRATRINVRNWVGEDHYIEVFVDTPLEICKESDIKGLYKKERSGEIKGFTGIDDPSEAPNNAETVLNKVSHTPKENAHWIVEYLARMGYVQAG